MKLIAAILESGFARTAASVRRLCAQGGVSVNGVVESNADATVREGDKIIVGKSGSFLVPKIRVGE